MNRAMQIARLYDRQSTLREEARTLEQIEALAIGIGHGHLAEVAATEMVAVESEIEDVVEELDNLLQRSC